MFGHRKKAGLSPGTVEYTGPRSGPVPISAIDYRETELVEESNISIEKALSLMDRQSVTWIDVGGIHDADIVRRLGEHAGLHSLIQEDLVSPRQRPKVEQDGNHIYIVVRMLDFDEHTRRVTSEQFSIVIGPRYVLTFQEIPGDIFGSLRDRIRLTTGRVRKRGPGYLGYAVLDAVIDHYYVVVDHVSELMDDLEERLLIEADRETESLIHELRRELVIIRRAVWPVRELLVAIDKMEQSHFDPDLKPFLRDAGDHINQLIDTTESLREASTGLLDLYHMALTNRANDIMKMLTMIATIFIPLTFLAGIYGMNFQYMPELSWQFGYPVVLIVMLAVAVILIFYFRRRRWL